MSTTSTRQTRSGRADSLLISNASVRSLRSRLGHLPTIRTRGSWLVTVVTDYLWDAERVAQSAQFEQLAEKYDSEYDGGEVYVGSLEALSPKGSAEPVQSSERVQKPSIWRRLFGRSSP